jgi:hypothetical protein
MSHPYESYEADPLWPAIDTALRDLSRNGDIQLMTARDYVIGYICQGIRTAIRDGGSTGVPADDLE